MQKYPPKLSIYFWNNSGTDEKKNSERVVGGPGLACRVTESPTGSVLGFITVRKMLPVILYWGHLPWSVGWGFFARIHWRWAVFRMGGPPEIGTKCIAKISRSSSDKKTQYFRAISRFAPGNFLASTLVRAKKGISTVFYQNRTCRSAHDRPRLLPP